MATIKERITKTLGGNTDAATVGARLTQTRVEFDRYTAELAALRQQRRHQDDRIGALIVGLELDGEDNAAAIGQLRGEIAATQARIAVVETTQTEQRVVVRELERRHHAAGVAEAHARQAAIAKEYHGLADQVERHLLAAADAQKRAHDLDDEERTLRGSSLLARADGASAPSKLQTAAGHDRHLGPDLAGFAEHLARVNAGKII